MSNTYSFKLFFQKIYSIVLWMLENKESSFILINIHLLYYLIHQMCCNNNLLKHSISLYLVIYSPLVNFFVLFIILFTVLFPEKQCLVLSFSTSSNPLKKNKSFFKRMNSFLIKSQHLLKSAFFCRPSFLSY